MGLNEYVKLEGTITPLHTPFNIKCINVVVYVFERL